MIKLNLIQLFILLGMLGCSLSSKSPTQIDINTVPISEGDNRSNKKVVLDKSKENQVNIAGKETKKEPKLGLYFGPGLNRTIAYTQFLKKLNDKKEEINFSVVSGVGMGAVYSVLYASGIPHSRIEWIFFKFFQDSSKVKLLSREWVNLVEKVFFPYIKYKNLEDLPLKVRIPLLDLNTRKIIYRAKGNIRYILKSNFEIIPRRKGKYASALLKIEQSEENLRYIGADLIISLNSLGKNIAFNYPNHFLSGFFGKIVTKKRTDLGGLFFEVNFPMDTLALDGRKEVSSLLGLSQKVAETEIEKFIEYKENWLEEDEN